MSEPLGLAALASSGTNFTAAAILIDATVVRGILIPAALALLGNRAWKLRSLPARG